MNGQDVPAPRDGQKQAPPSQFDCAAEPAASYDSPVNILIVDDEPKNLTVLESLLDDPGYRLVRAESADQALLALVVEEFALLILDIRMPDMTGFELAQMIKERKKTSLVPIIFLTAYYNEDQHMLEGYGSGAVDYLHKPVNPAILRSKVSVFAELYRKRRECGLANRALLAEMTQRRRAQEQLRALNATLEQRVTEQTKTLRGSEERMRLATEATAVGIWEWNVLTGQLWWDAQMFQIYGRTPTPDGFVQYSDWIGSIVPEDLPEKERVLQETVHRCGNSRSEFRIHRQDDQECRHIQSVETVRPAAPGPAEWVVGTNLDVTERKRIETAQRQSEKRYRTLFELGPVGVYSCEAGGAVREFNPRAAELWGRKPKPGDVVDLFSGAHKLYHPNGSFMPHDQCPMAGVLSGKMPRACDLEVIIERPDGSRVLVLENIAPLRDERGAITGAINCFVDITALKQAMEAQSRLDTLTVTNRELEREIARRQVVEKSLQSSELHLSQSLDKSRHLAHQILSAHEEERKQISQELHDEVAQSLAGIGVQLSALGAEAMRNPKGLAKKVALTQKLVTKSMHTVHRFARELRPAILDDLGLVAALHSFLKEFKQRTGLQVHFTAFTAGEIDRLDSKKRAVLYRVAQSALNNSAQHAKGSLVNVSLQKIPGAISMEIKDNGKGFQVERVLIAKRYKRLGLPIMKERVEMAGGSFAVESIRGTGTTIRVQIPVDDGAHQI